MRYWKLNDEELASRRADVSEVESNWQRIQRALQEGQLLSLSENDRSLLSALVSGELERDSHVFLETRVQRVVAGLFENKSSHLDEKTRNMPPKQWWWNEVSIKEWYERGDGTILAELECYVGGGETETLDFIIQADWLDMTDEQLQGVLRAALAREDARQRKTEIASATSALADAQRRLDRAKGSR